MRTVRRHRGRRLPICKDRPSQWDTLANDNRSVGRANLETVSKFGIRSQSCHDPDSQVYCFPHPSPLPAVEGAVCSRCAIPSPFGRGTQGEGIRATMSTNLKVLRQSHLLLSLRLSALFFLLLGPDSHVEPLRSTGQFGYSHARGVIDGIKYSGDCRHYCAFTNLFCTVRAVGFIGFHNDALHRRHIQGCRDTGTRLETRSRFGHESRTSPPQRDTRPIP